MSTKPLLFAFLLFVNTIPAVSSYLPFMDLQYDIFMQFEK